MFVNDHGRSLPRFTRINCRGDHNNFAVYRRNFIFKLMVVHDHIGRSSWRMDTALQILVRSSGSESPSLDM